MKRRVQPPPTLIGGFPAVPTTKVLAVSRLLNPLTAEQRKIAMPREVPATVRLFWRGKLINGGHARTGKARSFY